MLNKKFFQNSLLLKNLRGSSDYLVVSMKAKSHGFAVDDKTYVIDNDLDRNLFNEMKNKLNFSRVETNVYKSEDGSVLEIHSPSSRTSYLVYRKEL